MKVANASGPETEADAAAMRRYLLGMVAGAVIVLGLMAAGLLLLRANGALPPPQFSNNLCMDEKLGLMRADPPRDPNLLVVGSSVAWRHFNSPLAVALRPGIRPYNAGFCGAKIAQTERVTAWLTRRLPSVERVMLIASPIDFDQCSGDEPARFDVEAADKFVFGGAWPVRYYLEYFDPWTLAKNARRVSRERNDIASFNSLVQDRYGDGPIEPPQSRGLFYSEVKTADPKCFAALRRTALALKAANTPFDVFVTPLNPDWVRIYASSRQTPAGLSRRIRAALAGTGARTHEAGVQPDQNAFFDAIHLRWSRTGPFTKAMLDQAYGPQQVRGGSS